MLNIIHQKTPNDSPSLLVLLLISCSIAEKSGAKFSTALWGNMQLNSLPCFLAFSALGTWDVTKRVMACSFQAPSRTNVRWQPMPNLFLRKRELPQQRSFPLEMTAFLSARISGDLENVTEFRCKNFAANDIPILGDLVIQGSSRLRGLFI